VKKRKKKPESTYKVTGVGAFPDDLSARISQVHALSVLNMAGEGSPLSGIRDGKVGQAKDMDGFL
jgi:hypothetical protein